MKFFEQVSFKRYLFFENVNSGMMKTTSTEAVDCNSIVFMSIAIKLDQTVYLCLTDDR